MSSFCLSGTTASGKRYYRSEFESPLNLSTWTHCGTTACGTARGTATGSRAYWTLSGTEAVPQRYDRNALRYLSGTVGGTTACKRYYRSRYRNIFCGSILCAILIAVSQSGTSRGSGTTAPGTGSTAMAKTAFLSSSPTMSPHDTHAKPETLRATLRSSDHNVLSEGTVHLANLSITNFVHG